MQPSQVAQWTRELEVRCCDPRRARTKMYLLDTFGNFVNDVAMGVNQKKKRTYMREKYPADEQSRDGNAIGDLFDDWASGSKRGRRNIGSTVVVDDDTNNQEDGGDECLAECQGPGI